MKKNKQAMGLVSLQVAKEILDCLCKVQSAFLGGSPLLKFTEASWEISEEPINSYNIQPIIIFCIWVLVEVVVQEYILIPEGIRMYLKFMFNMLSSFMMFYHLSIKEKPAQTDISMKMLSYLQIM